MLTEQEVVFTMTEEALIYLEEGNYDAVRETLLALQERLGTRDEDPLDFNREMRGVGVEYPSDDNEDNDDYYEQANRSWN